LAVLARNVSEAQDYCGAALAVVREAFEPETTARNLRLIREARSVRGEDVGWLAEIEEGLREAQSHLESPNRASS
jgi:hypothetical protein